MKQDIIKEILNQDPHKIIDNEFLDNYWVMLHYLINTHKKCKDKSTKAELKNQIENLGGIFLKSVSSK